MNFLLFASVCLASLIFIFYIILASVRKNKHLRELVELKWRVQYLREITQIKVELSNEKDKQRELVNLIESAIETLIRCSIFDEEIEYEYYKCEILNYAPLLLIIIQSDKNLKNLNILSEIA